MKDRKESIAMLTLLARTAVIAAAGLSLVVAAAPAMAATRAPAHTITIPSLGDQPHHPDTLTLPLAAPATSEKHCTAGRKSLCVTVASTTTDTRRSIGKAAGNVWCSGQSSGWHITRTALCKASTTVTTTHTELPSGRILGEAKVLIEQNAQLQPRTLTWVETVYFTMLSGSGTLARMKYGLVASCGDLCTSSSNPASSEVLTQGMAATATITYTANPVDQMTRYVDYGVEAVAPDAGVPPTVQYGNPVGAAFRCDRVVGSAPGCVYPGVKPTLFIRISQSGAGAMNVLFAQSSLPDHWGRDKPLHRLVNQGNNRSVICDSTFVNDPRVPTDSCDEFPFAASYESGNFFGLRGSDCAEIRPYRNASTGSWVVEEIKPVAYTERCLRGHIPLSENVSVGGVYSAFIQSDSRVLDYDAFWIEVLD
jgi:hypothetical protein